MKARPNAQRSTLNVQRSTFELPHSRTLELPNFRTSPLPRNGFTLFELLGVLTLIGIVLVMLLGSYGSWGTAHALTGATRILESGLQQARSLARTRNEYVGFEYGTFKTNNVTTVTGFQLYLCTNEHATVASVLSQLQGGQPLTDTQVQTLLENLGVTPASPYQRLSGHVSLAYRPDAPNAQPEDNGVLFFRPDGSVWSAGDTQCHYVQANTKSLFNKVPLSRILRVDLTTGLVTVIKEEVQP